MQKLLIGTNLKMYKGIQETSDYLTLMQSLTGDILSDVTPFVIPSFTSLAAAAQTVRGKSILLGAQNMCAAEMGQYTGEISPHMLQEIGIDIVEIGHSERRTLFHETDQDENAKILSALVHGFTALYCIGESAFDKECGIASETLLIQLKVGLKGVDTANAAHLWIAYEPAWAIGTGGTPASPAYIERQHAVIKKVLHNLFPTVDIPVLYGGSVNPGNACDIIRLPNVDGLFIGRAAWGAQPFNLLIRDVLRVWENKGIHTGKELDRE